MKTLRSLNSFDVRPLTSLFLLAGAIPAYGACNVPAYEGGVKWADTPTEVLVSLSIRLEDFTPGKLVCLAGELKRFFAGRNVLASILSSHEAAMNYTPLEIDATVEMRQAQRQLHGDYVYNKDTHEEYVEIIPNGLETDPSLITRVDLPVTGTPVCKLRIHDRCLIEFEKIEYPDNGYNKNKVVGQVTVSGTIGRDGVLQNPSLVGAKVTPTERQTELSQWVVHNLSTWRFEPSEQEDAVRLTYYFELFEPAPAAGGAKRWLPEERVQFHLPNEVRVQAERAR